MTDGSTWPPSPYDPGAPVTPPPAVYQVVVKPTLKNLLAQAILGVLFLVLGFGAVVVAMLSTLMQGRTVALVAGSIFALLGLLVCFTLTRAWRPRTYTFTRAGFEGQDAAGRAFWLPWSDLESIAVEAWGKRSLWFYVAMRRPYPTNGHLLITVRPGAELAGNLARWAKWKQVRLPFWRRHELVDSFAYACRTYAGSKFRGVIVR